MAARRSSTLDPRHRAAIRTTMLVKRLQSFALSEPDPQTGQPVMMTRDQVAAAAALLRKVMPDLATMQVQGDDEKPLNLAMTVRFVRPAEAA